MVEKVTEHFRRENTVIDIDSARVLFDDGWGLLGASNTQPGLVPRFEALSESRLTQIRDYVESSQASIQEHL